MQQTRAARARYTLDYAGHRIEVEVTAAGLTNVARLFIDGRQVDQQQASLGDRSRLQGDTVTVVVQWGWWSGHVAKCVLVEERDTGKAQPEIDETPFEPPPGTRAARLAQFQREHPALYATRHVALATLQVLLPLLGLGALITALLPQIDWSWITGIVAFVRSLLLQIRAWIPDIDLPFSIPREWILWIVNSPWFAWAKRGFVWAKWVLPIIIAIFVAIAEFQRYQRKQHQQHQANHTLPTDQPDRHEGQAR
jgi:hypothetical protein